MKNNIKDFENYNREDLIDVLNSDELNAVLRTIDYKSGSIPIIIKDIISYKGVEISNASNILKGYKPPFNSIVVNRLLRNDFDIVGVSNMDEFAMGGTNKTSVFGPVVHPENEDYVPGGSSGGSAALVSSGVVPVALGTDTGGSVRQPSSYTGIYGMKPTYGLIPRYGVYSFASSFDTIGIMSNSVEDNAFVLSKLAGSCSYDQTSYTPENFDAFKTIDQDLKGKKVGVLKSWIDEIKDEEIKKSLNNQIAKLVELGCEVVEVELENSEKAFELYMMLAYSEATSNLNRYDGIRYGYQGDDKYEGIYVDNRSVFGFEVRKRLIIGAYVTSSKNSKKYYVHSQKIRQKMEDDFKEIIKTVDFLVAPTTPNKGIKLDGGHEEKEAYLSDKFTIPFNLVGVPSMSVPCEKTDDGFNVGMQIIADKYQENVIYQVAKRLEEK